MESVPRKASEVLLDLERKIDNILSIIMALDLNIKVLSNKYTTLISFLQSQKITHDKAPIPIEINNDTQISSEFTIPIEQEPIGIRRTSRPDSFINESLPATKQTIKKEETINTDIFVQTDNKNNINLNKPKNITQNTVPVIQRVVNSLGKSLFLADVEIINIDTIELVAKTRTNGVGKWQFPLPVGSYRIIIKKFEQATKEKLEAIQEIQIDGQTSPLELSTIIVK